MGDKACRASTRILDIAEREGYNPVKIQEARDTINSTEIHHCILHRGIQNFVQKTRQKHH